MYIHLPNCSKCSIPWIPTASTALRTYHSEWCPQTKTNHITQRTMYKGLGKKIPSITLNNRSLDAGTQHIHFRATAQLHRALKWIPRRWDMHYQAGANGTTPQCIDTDESLSEGISTPRLALQHHFTTSKLQLQFQLLFLTVARGTGAVEERKLQHLYQTRLLTTLDIVHIPSILV